MRNTHSDPAIFEPPAHLAFDRTLHMQRVLHVIDYALTPRQRAMVQGFYFRGESIPALAKQLGINRVSAWRLLKRAEARMKRYLSY
ncbi:MAG: sigma-70 family RNA polymerase sigma factor [Firmicutes bacterium]|nr:sigma-70 family RNA polymerase sigma factor [Bacillota bacterium]